MDERSGEEVRNITSVLRADPRTENFQIRDRVTSEWRQVSLEDQCAGVHDLDLPQSVDQDVRIQFNLARNLLVIRMVRISVPFAQPIAGTALPRASLAAPCA